MVSPVYQMISTEVAAHIHIRRILLVVLAVSLLVNVCLSIRMILHHDETTTIVLSPTATESYIATSSTVSVNLLERFALGSLDLISNMTPASGPWQIDRFMKNVAPESYASIDSRLRSDLQELIRNDASRAFFTHADEVDPKLNLVCIKGEQRLMISNTVTSSKKMMMCIRLTVRSGRLQIVEITVDPYEKKGSESFTESSQS